MQKDDGFFLKNYFPDTSEFMFKEIDLKLLVYKQTIGQPLTAMTLYRQLGVLNFALKVVKSVYLRVLFFFLPLTIQ